MYYYQRVKDLREDMDLRQEDLGKLLNITRQQYQLYECGKREIPVHLLIMLADYYNVSLDYAAGRTNSKKGLSSSLNEEESWLLEAYEAFSERRKGKLEQFVSQLLEEERQDSF